MCGVFGWIGEAGQCPSELVLRKATNLLFHRGPDGGGYELLQTADGRHSIGFGHRRLSIIDLSNAADQPMWSVDRRFCLIFNGEIYNYVELRKELQQQHSCRFVTESDSEVLIESIRVWGKAALIRFRGMFSFALFDRHDQSILLARDPFGKKPLFLGALGSTVIFSSEIEAILEVPGFGRNFDVLALEGYLIDRYVPSPLTFFEKITKLPPGCFAEWKNGLMLIERFYTPPIATTEPNLSDFQSTVRLFTDVFDDAVRIRMRSDAPFGAFLSGGLDSSAVVAMMKRHASRPVRTFSVGFNEKSYSELDYCNLVAKTFGTEHQSIIVTSQDFFDNWENAIRHRGAPVSEPSDIPFMLLARAARSSVKMVLTGEGADELLAGYPKHVAECYTAQYQRLVPAAMHQHVFGRAINLLPYGMRRIKVLAKALGERDPADRVRIWFGGISYAERECLLGYQPSGEVIAPFPFSIQTTSNFRRSMFFDQTSWLPDSSLERADRMMMAGSIEGRMPFMDTELAALAARMPDSFLVSGGRGKVILRHAMRNIVPSAILGRRKTGFRVPVHEWFRGKHRSLVRDLLSSHSSKTRQLLNSELIDRLVVDHLDGRVNNERILWSLCNLELFLRVYKPDLGVAEGRAA